jgi:ABC-type bacteriocin/lantibiotic exporter with double-glycine peptidase domain
MIAAIRAFIPVLGGTRRVLLLTAALALVQSLLTVPIGLLFKRVIDHTIPGGHGGELLVICGLLIVCGLATSGLALYTRHLVLGATKHAVMMLRARLLEHVQALPASWADRQDSGLLHTVIVQDTERIDTMLSATAGDLLPAVIVATALSIAMLVVNPILFVILVPVVPSMMLVTRAIEQRLIGRTRAWHQAFDHFSVHTHFLLRARSLIAAFGTEGDELRTARARLHGVRDTSRSMVWLNSAYAQAGSAITTCAAVLVLLVGGLLVINKDATIGSLVAFYALAALTRGQLSAIVNAVPQIVEAGQSLARLDALLDADPPQPYDGDRDPGAVLPLTVSDVRFGYDGGAPVLAGASLELHRGDVVVITGPNGAGKTTLAGLIAGFYAPQSGSLSAAGTPYAELDMRAVRRRLAIVDQDPILFSGTIAENIAYGSPDATESEIRQAARSATANAFIDELPQGFDTPVGEQGVLLSGGQRQRIAIARALLRAPELLILDEPTASLDQRSIAELGAMLNDGAGAGAILVISHNPEVIAAADRIYTLSDGLLHLAGSSLAAAPRQGR